MMNSKQLFSLLPGATITGSLRRGIGQVVDDDRKVTPGSCFIAAIGLTVTS